MSASGQLSQQGLDRTVWGRCWSDVNMHSPAKGISLRPPQEEAYASGVQFDATARQVAGVNSALRRNPKKASNKEDGYSKLSYLAREVEWRQASTSILRIGVVIGKRGLIVSVP